MTSKTRTSRTVISSVAVAVAIFAAVMAFESRSTSFDEAGSAQSNSSSGGMAADMPGMDMSGTEPTPTPTPTPSMAADMPGMDMSGTEPTPTPSMAADMPGMDMPATDMPGSTSAPTPTSSGDMPSGEMPGMDMPGPDSGSGATQIPGHDNAAEAGPSRPLAPVLGTFGGGSAAVLLTAGMLRRKDRAANLAKKAARVAGRAHK